MDQDNVIEELPEPFVGGSNDTKENIIPKDFSDKNIAIVLSIMSIVGFFYDVLISDVKTCLNQTKSTKNKICRKNPRKKSKQKSSIVANKNENLGQWIYSHGIWHPVYKW